MIFKTSPRHRALAAAAGALRDACADLQLSAYEARAELAAPATAAAAHATIAPHVDRVAAAFAELGRLAGRPGRGAAGRMGD